MSDPSDREIETQRQLATILERVDGIKTIIADNQADVRRDIDQLRDEHQETERTAIQGRRAIHDRLDETNKGFGKLENDIRVIGGQVAQNRDIINEHTKDVAALNKTLTDDVMPAVRTVVLIEGTGKRYLVAAAVAGGGLVTTIFGLIAANWEHIWAWIKATF